MIDMLYPLLATIVLICVCVFLAFLLDWRFMRSLTRSGRTVKWEDLVPRLVAGQGSLILNRTNAPGAVWWTEERIEIDRASAALLSYAKLTDCPRSMRDAAALERAYPRIKVIELRGVIRRRRTRNREGNKGDRSIYGDKQQGRA